MQQIHHLRIRGIVQGVGFRPFVWRLAREMGAYGTVQNDNEGVVIKLTGVDVKQFVARLRAQAPPAAQISAIEVREVREEQGTFDDFHIIASAPSSGITAISPDLATCLDCVAEIFAPGDRRYHYAFSNCTNCGPRLSIIRHLPYDRANTAMADFPLCAACAAEYHDPWNRRFHAEPLACPACGPKLWLEVKEARYDEALALSRAAEMIVQGAILAIKGIGGFHLACDAGNELAVRRLRALKGRPRKPFALMAADLAQVRLYADVSPREEEALCASAAPIVLLNKQGLDLAPSIAPGQLSLGLMLAYSPLHHLLMAQLTRPIVLTSANFHDEPQVCDHATARHELGSMADGFLMHEREITQQIDDSVVRLSVHGPIMLRRARGFAPAPLKLHRGFADLPSALGMGADLKSTITALVQGEATMSQHLGDLATVRSRAAYDQALALFLSLNNFKPCAVAHDWHQDFYSTVAAQRLAAAHEVPLIAVQHHHAHSASVMAENGLPPDAPPVLGLALDGVGLGEQGALWGGEFLRCDFKDFSRLNHFKPLRLLGADASARAPWRCLAAVWAQAGREPETLKNIASFAAISAQQLQQFSAAHKNERLTVASTALGRWFDAYAALCGICVEAQDYEAEAPQLLEALAAETTSTARFETSGLDLTSVFLQAADELARGFEKSLLARKFHNSLIAMISAEAQRLCGLHGLDSVALSGGVFNNCLLRDGIIDQLAKSGLKLLYHHHIPAGDGGISLGQAAIAAAR